MSTTQYLLTNRVSGREKLYRAGSGRAAARGMHALPGPCTCMWYIVTLTAHRTKRKERVSMQRYVNAYKGSQRSLSY